MSDGPNIFVSNGTCYSAPGEELDGSFIPCGNDAFGHQTCCGAGDNCLSNNACFGIHGEGYGSYLTYMAGCTDPDYEDQGCPDKEDIDQPWIALTHCGDSGGEWAPCSQEGDPTTLQPGSYCSCTDASETTVAFSAGTSLTNIASLPESTGESIQFFAGHFPTSPESSSETTSAEAPSSDGDTTATSIQTGSATPSPGTTPTQTTGLTTSSQGTTPTQTGSATSSLSDTSTGDSSTASPSGTGTALSDGGSDSGELSTGAIIGIGVGAGVGGLLIILAAMAFFVRRKRRRLSSPSTGTIDGGDKEPLPDIPDPTAPEADGQAVSEADGRAAQPWSLRKAELEESRPLTPPPPNNKAESGSGAVGRVIKPYRKDPTVPEADGQPVSEADGRAISTEEPARRGQVTGGDAHGVSRMRRNAEFGTVAELPGSESWH
ncbi:hypothetical protein DL764_007372 [Monosporascus ibericus]|uniref:Mid2 domain-containing protein n=1 Tax=Monosporascus ibericus TaxID=155417 RepID=A0A4Q4T1E6_9PEZI|nr:hypothetical protein DL764_007372 [Monosporascus ibericus]